MEQVTFPITLYKGNETKTANSEAQLAAFEKAGFTRKSETPTPPPSAAKGGKRRLTPEEANRMADANLSEGFGMPSDLALMGEGYEDTLTITDLIEQVSKKTGQKFPSTQVDWMGTKFCILFNRGHVPGGVIRFRLTATDATRSGLTVTEVG